MKQKVFILFAVIAVFAAGCLNDDKKPMEESRDMRNNVEQDLNKPQNIQYNDQSPTNMDTTLEKTHYAKWGKMALQETKEKYPDSRISDYQYDTRRVSPDGTITDYFDFTVFQDDQKRLVKVGVMHTNDKLIDMKFEEMS
jgi:Protein of unknown function (DUF3889)